MLYSCEAADFPNDTKKEQLELVEENCQEKEACQIDVSREYFGDTECPGTEDEKMSLWLTYSCDGGGTDRTTVNNPRCKG